MGVAHGRVAAERGGDLAQLDPEAADLDLAVLATEEVEIAVREAADAVAAGVEAGARLGGEGVGEEALRRQVRAAQIPPGDACSAQQQLARGRRRAAAASSGPGRGRSVPAIGRPIAGRPSAWPRGATSPAVEVAVFSVGPYSLRSRKGISGRGRQCRRSPPAISSRSEQQDGHGRSSRSSASGVGDLGHGDAALEQPRLQARRCQPGLLVRHADAGAGRERVARRR